VPHSRPPQRIARVPRLGLEPLEDRTLLSGTPTIIWDGEAGTNQWADAANWTEDRLPGAYDVALIPVGTPAVVVDTAAAVLGLRAETGLVVNDSLTLSADSELLGHLSVYGPGGLTVLGGTLDLGGGAYLPSTLTVASGATVRFSAGEFSSHAGGVVEGTLDIASGVTVSLVFGTLTLNGGAAVTGAGRLALTSSYASGVQLEVAGGVGVGNLTLGAGAAVIGGGTLTVTGLLDWAGGDMRGTGTTVVPTGSQLLLRGGGYFVDRTLTNAGTVQWVGGGLVAGLFDHGGTFRNLAGGVVTASAGGLESYFATTPVTFQNDGVFRVAGAGRFDVVNAVFNNTGSVEVLGGGELGFHSSNPLVQTQSGTNTGPIALAAGANFLVSAAVYTFAGGTAVTGAGVARLGYRGHLVVEGAVSARNLALGGPEASLDGPGTLTVTGTLGWESGRMSGPGLTLLPAGATLALTVTGPVSEYRHLDGRRLVNRGQTVWDQPAFWGLVGRWTSPASGGGYWEAYDNSGVDQTPVAPAAFDPIAAAGELYRAMYGGLTGWGTTEETIWRVLSGKSFTQLNAIRSAYAAMYSGRSLDTDVYDELFLRERERGVALLAGNAVRADAAGLRHALHGGTGLWVDQDDIFAILDGKPHTHVLAVAAEYESYYGQTLASSFQEKLSGSEQRRALALLAGNQGAADAEALYYAMNGGSGIGTDEATIWRILGSRDAGQLAAIRAAYFAEHGRTLDADLQSDLDDAEMDRANALMAGDLIGAAAARLKIAMQGVGTDEDEVWATLDGLTSEKRAAIAQVYRERYGEELSADIYSEFSNTTVLGDELNRTLALLHRGGLTLAERLYYAMKGWGTDKPALRRALAKVSLMNVPQIAALDLQFQALSDGVPLRTAIEDDLTFFGVGGARVVRGRTGPREPVADRPRSARAARGAAGVRADRDRLVHDRLVQLGRSAARRPSGGRPSRVRGGARRGNHGR
jgi:hypothetical protein